jgi:hypothetical protein
MAEGLRLGCACAPSPEGERQRRMWDRAWIRDAVVATTVRVGVRALLALRDVPSAPNVHAALPGKGRGPLSPAAAFLRYQAIGASSGLGEPMWLAGFERLSFRSWRGARTPAAKSTTATTPKA